MAIMIRVKIEGLNAYVALSTALRTIGILE
jgi:hypothetical protein